MDLAAQQLTSRPAGRPAGRSGLPGTGPARRDQEAAMTHPRPPITAELLEHADGRPVAYIDATAVAVFACQQPDGTYVIDISTRDDTAAGQLHLPLDCKSLVLSMSACPARSDSGK